MQKMNFEEYLDNITLVLEKLGDDSVGLNESFALYKEGMKNLQAAQKMLEEVQLQCEELKMQSKKEEE